jgi:excisionase family DNA binding protein
MSTEIMTVDELASMLKMTRRQIYELTRTCKRATMDHPVPILRINGNIRFRRSDIEAWLEELAAESRARKRTA